MPGYAGHGLTATHRDGIFPLLLDLAVRGPHKVLHRRDVDHLLQPDGVDAHAAAVVVLLHLLVLHRDRAAAAIYLALEPVPEAHHALAALLHRGLPLVDEPPPNVVVGVVEGGDVPGGDLDDAGPLVQVLCPA